jgi:spore coat protein A
MSVSRRDFIKWSAAAGTWVYVSGLTGGSTFLRAASAAPIPGGTLAPASVPKYQTPLLIPPVMPKAGTIKRQMGKNADYYEISMKQIMQQILPAGLPATPVWGYGAVAADSKRGLLLHNAPSLTIEAKADTPVQIKWINDLVDGDGNYLPHLLTVDQTLHWANPPGGSAGRDTRPDYTGQDTPEPYTGPVPMVTHVHGAVGVGDESDGYTEAWYLPDANDIPAGYATEGTWYDFLADKASAAFGVSWGPGYAIFEYPNLNRASTIWYHDHSLGMTRLNVYAGPAGFYRCRARQPRRHARRPSRTGSQGERQVPAQQDLLRDTDRDPGSRVQRRRHAVLPVFPRVLRRVHGSLHPGFRPLAELEPGVLRQHDDGQRQHVAVPDGGAAPVSSAVPQRLPVPLPDP